MDVSTLGRVLRTNRVKIQDESVSKHYGNFYVSMAWGPLERKPYQSAGARYEKEKETMMKLYKAGCNTPELLWYDDKERTLVTRELELEDLVTVMKKKGLDEEEKLELVREAMLELRGIHGAGMVHGDTYAKNFALLKPKSVNGRGRVFTYDFEYKRETDNPKTYDVMLLAANLAQLIPRKSGEVLGIVSETFPQRQRFNFDFRDKFFFRRRFGAKKEFFDTFSK